MNIEAASASAAEQFLTFRLGDEEFGVEIRRVQGIQGWNKATQIPQTPNHILGVIDLRGTVVPIIDLRRRLGFENCDFSSTTVVIVVKVAVDGEERTFGLVVDAVSEVRDIPSEERKERPDFGAGIKAPYVDGLATIGDQMIILLDLDELMSETEFPEDEAVQLPETSKNKSAEEAPAADEAKESFDIEAIENSFALLAPQADELVNRFYDKLFEQYPDVQPMFAQTDMKEQKRKLIGAISLVVENLRNPSALESTLATLGARHEQIGAETAHYEAVASTLLAVLEEMAGETWTPQFEEAWSSALKAVADGMLAAYTADTPAGAVA